MNARTPSRRRFLAYVGGALVAAGGLAAIVRTRGYAVAPARAASLKSLAPWQLIVFEHAARRIAAPDDETPAPPSPDDVDVAGFIDAYVAHMAPPIRRDLLRLVAFVEHIAPFAVGLTSRFTRLAPADQDRVLAGLEASDQTLLRGGFAGLKSLVFMGYYRDPRTWKALHYEGPLIGRPEGGWSP